MKKFKAIINTWGKSIGLALILAIFFKTFAFQFYKVQSDKMANLITKQNRVIVNKTSFGIRLPITLFSIPFITHKYFTKPSLPYIRLFTKSPKHNEIIAFNNPSDTSKPIDKRAISISRCVGQPGDTLQIIGQELFINGKLIEPNPKAVFKYRLFENGNKNKLGFKDTLVCNSSLNKINLHTSTRIIYKLTSLPGEKYEDYFPHNKIFQWNADYFGPIIIPKKDNGIVLSHKNRALYSSIIKRENSSSDISINSTYTFKNNYYFVLNDNWTNTNDSRKWGLIPESHLIGKIIYSTKKQIGGLVK